MLFLLLELAKKEDNSILSTSVIDQKPEVNNFDLEDSILAKYRFEGQNPWCDTRNGDLAILDIANMWLYFHKP